MPHRRLRERRFQSRVEFEGDTLDKFAVGERAVAAQCIDKREVARAPRDSAFISFNQISECRFSPFTRRHEFHLAGLSAVESNADDACRRAYVEHRVLR
jgi:hypothetical protein